MIQIEKKTQEGKEPLYYVQMNDDLPFGYVLTQEQLEELYLKICQHLFDNLLEQNKDLLMRLKNNEPAPKRLDSNKVIAWLEDIIPAAGPAGLIDIFKKEFGL